MRTPHTPGGSAYWRKPSESTLRDLLTAARPANDSERSSLLAAIRAAHAKIEASPTMMRPVSDDFTVREYIGHLAALLGFYEPFEAALVQGAVGAVQTLPRCEGLPSIQGPGTLGAVYVYENSALGGQVIARRLRRSLGAKPERASADITGMSL